MSKLCIPAVGDKITLKKAWTFALFHERRNWDLLIQLGHIDTSSNDRYSRWRLTGDTSTLITIPAGSVLVIDRIYIKRAEKTQCGYNKDGEFNSLSFRFEKGSKKPYSGRFWAKLRDVNTIDCNIEHVVGV